MGNPRLKEDVDIEEKEAYIARELGAILIDYETNKFYETNDTATRILQLLQEFKSASEIIEIICNEYDIDQDTVQQDVNEFIEKLGKYKLLEE